MVFDAERNCCKPSWSESLKVTPLFSSPRHMICLYNSNQVQKQNADLIKNGENSEKVKLL